MTDPKPPTPEETHDFYHPNDTRCTPEGNRDGCWLLVALRVQRSAGRRETWSQAHRRFVAFRQRGGGILLAWDAPSDEVPVEHNRGHFKEEERQLRALAEEAPDAD